MKNLLIKNNYTMKKWFLSLLIIISGLSMQAQSISIDDYNQAPGTSLLVSVNMDNISNMGAFTLFVGYDSLVLEFDTIINIHPQFAALLGNNMQNLQQVGIVWNAVSSGISVVSETLCDIRFNYIDSSSNITFNSGCEVADYNADIISTTFNNGSISESFIVEIIGLDLSYCINDTASVFSGTPTGGTFKIDGTIATEFDPGIQGAGTFLISYAYVNNFGFGDTVYVSVEVFDNPSIFLQSSGLICFSAGTGDATAIILSGQTPYTYSWSDGQTTQTASSLTAGTYQVTVTDGNGCSINDNIQLFASDEIVYSIVETHLSGVGANDGAIDLNITAGSSPFGVLWSTGSTLEDLSNLPNDMYYLTITDDLGCTVQDSVEIKINSSQQIIIPQQWSIVSFNIDLLEPLFDSAFTDVLPNLVLAKDENGLVFWTFFQLNAIGDVQIGEAYQVRLTNQDTINNTGFYIFPENTSVDLPYGWSLFGYLRTSPALVIPTLAPYVNNIVIVKDSQGHVYWPVFVLDLIVNFNPGEGYQIKMTAQETLIYPPN